MPSSDRSTQDALAAYFPEGEVRWKPQTSKNGKAMAVAYIDARHVMDRLDTVLGTENWSDDYAPTGDGKTVVCRLSCKINGEWVMKTDIGGVSEQPDAGDKQKAAYSEALKRAAVKFGIGRYLYRLPKQWVQYNEQTRQLTEKPRLPDWAKPRGSAPTGAAQRQAATPRVEQPPAQPKPAPAPQPRTTSTPTPATATPPKPAPAPEPERKPDAPVCTKQQIDEIDLLLRDRGWDWNKFVASIKRKFGVDDPRKLSSDQAATIINGFKTTATAAAA